MRKGETQYSPVLRKDWHPLWAFVEVKWRPRGPPESPDLKQTEKPGLLPGLLVPGPMLYLAEKICQGNIHL